MRELETLASGKRDNTVNRVEGQITNKQVGHWRRWPRHSEPLLAFIRQWYAETGTYPSIEWMRFVFGADYFAVRRGENAEARG